MESEPHSVGEVVQGLEELSEGSSKVKFADVLDKFGARSFAPVMMVLALIEISPLGALPGVPTFLAACIALIAAQMVVGRDHIWVPQWLAQRSVPGKKMGDASHKLERPAEKLDGVAKERFNFLTTGPSLRIAGATIVLLCLAVPPLEVLPWASSGPMIAIAVISLAIMVRDGLAMLIAWLLTAVAVAGIGYYYFSSGTGDGGFLPF